MTKRVCNQKIGLNHKSNMKKTTIVVIITLVTMVIEILYGIISGSMALLADGIHMGTHSFALVIALVAYSVTLKNKDNPNFAFSSGKVSILGGYTNAIILGLTAVYMVSEAINRLINPETIHFNQALIVALIGLIINIISAFLLSSGEEHHHHHGDEEHHHDHNLRAAYIHVITDAMTSILAIAALIFGKLFNVTWPDAFVAILGAFVILKWAYGLLISSGKLLVDYYPVTNDYEVIDEIVKNSGSTILDLHIWKTSENSKTIILEIKPGLNFEKQIFADKIKSQCKCDHLTLELTT